MAIDIGFKKWNQCWMSRLPTDNPLLCFGTVKKTVPGLYELDQKRSCVVCMKLFELNGLCWVEINRLMHELNVLTRSHNVTPQIPPGTSLHTNNHLHHESTNKIHK